MAEEVDLDRFCKVVFVLPVPRAVGVDPNVQEMIGRVEAERGPQPRLFEVHVPAEELPLATPVDVDRVRRAALVDHQPPSVPLGFLVSPAASLELGDRQAAAARPANRRPLGDPEDRSPPGLLDHRRGHRAKDLPRPDEAEDHLIEG
jgi:hypothetical protein